MNNSQCFSIVHLCPQVHLSTYMKHLHEEASLQCHHVPPDLHSKVDCNHSVCVCGIRKHGKHTYPILPIAHTSLVLKCSAMSALV